MVVLSAIFDVLSSIVSAFFQVLGALVKAADKLSAYLKCVEELKAGNLEFKKAGEQTYEALRQNPLPALAYFMERFLPGFHLTLDELQGSGDEIFGQTTIDLTSGKEGTQL